MNEKQRRVQIRRMLQWFLAPVVIITIALGWKYPWLAFSVPIVMVLGMIGGFVNGRFVCGNWCPRGAFWDRMVAPLASTREAPAFLRHMWFRVIVMAGLMGFMVYRIMLNPSDPMHWGRTFWLMCVVTTGIGLVLAVFFIERSWCLFCPMGTMQNLFSRKGATEMLMIDGTKCIMCRKCERTCPVSLPITSYKNAGIMQDPDCLKCGECVTVCPKDALALKNSEQ